MGCEGSAGGDLSVCSPIATTATLLQQLQHLQQQQQLRPHPYQWPSVAVLAGVGGFTAAAAAKEESCEKAAGLSLGSIISGSGSGGTMVVLTWKGRSVTAHHTIQPRPHVTPPPSVNNHHNEKRETAQPNIAYSGSSHNGGGEHSNSSSGSSNSSTGATDDRELGAYWEILDREIRPLPPLANSPDSQQIFNDHKEMARNYLVLQQELFNLRKCKGDLEGKLSEAEQLEQMNNHRYQDKIRQLEGKRESLRNNHKHLRQQLEHIRNQTARAAHNSSLHHPPP